MTPEQREGRIWRIVVAVILIMQLIDHARLLAWPGFAQDDFCWLEDARRSLNHFSRVTTLHISGFFRPLVHISFVLNYIASGLNPASYFAVNIGLEIGCILLVGRLARAVGLGVWPGLAAMLLFASHGAHVEAIGWISGRTTSIWAMMGLVCLLCWLRWRRTGSVGWYVAAVIGFVAALASKEEAVALLPIVVVMDLLIRPPAREAGTARTQQFHSRILSWLPLLLLCGGYLYMQYRFQSRNLLVSDGQYHLNAEALANWFYRIPRLFLTLRVGSLSIALAFSAAGLALAAIILVGARRETVAIALFGIALAAFALAPTSPFRSLPPGNLASRYSYFATIGAALASAALLQAAMVRPRWRRETTIAMASLLIVAVVSQHHRQRSGLRMWERESIRGAEVFAGLSQSPALMELPRRTGLRIAIENTPMGMAHFASAIWLLTGVPPTRVVGPNPSLDQYQNDTIFMRWNDMAHRLERH